MTQEQLREIWADIMRQPGDYGALTKQQLFSVVEACAQWLENPPGLAESLEGVLGKAAHSRLPIQILGKVAAARREELIEEYKAERQAERQALIEAAEGKAR